jgi:hypothetical protein
VVRASSQVRNLQRRVSYLGEKRLDPPVRPWYHMCTWSHKVRRRPEPLCDCQPRAGPGEVGLLSELQEAGQLHGVPLGTNPGAGLCRAPSKLLEGGTWMGAWA